VSGACFADFGHHVTCVDKDADRIARLCKGEIPYSSRISTVLSSEHAGEAARFHHRLSDGGRGDAVFIAVGTLRARRRSSDLSTPCAAGRRSLRLDGFTVVITKSTCSRHGDESSHHRETRPDGRRRRGVDRNSCARRCDPGFQAPDRIVVGAETNAPAVMANSTALYLNQAAIVYTSRRTPS